MQKDEEAVALRGKAVALRATLVKDERDVDLLTDVDFDVLVAFWSR